jgi:hypothetical protein
MLKTASSARSADVRSQQMLACSAAAVQLLFCTCFAQRTSCFSVLQAAAGDGDHHLQEVEG